MSTVCGMYVPMSPNTTSIWLPSASGTRTFETLLLQEDQELAREKVSANAQDNGPMATGSRIGPYKILDALGEGGFGTVYRAEQSRPVKRNVALKVVKAGMDTKQVLARFEAERQALAMMNHPNIARVFNAGVTDTGYPYFVMELVEGESVTTYCDRHQFTVDQRLDLFNQICEAIQHAHQRGVIHRDVKPSNVLITLQDDRPVPKVIDFGVARAMAQPLIEETLVTEQGLLIGTPAYMSPEQAERSGLDIDTRSDVYSLGVLLYELLTGALPFDAQSMQEAGFAEIPRILREVEPPVPSRKVIALADQSDTVARWRRTSPDGLHRRLRGELDWIVMKALEKDRNRRYPTPMDLARDVQRHMAREPVEAAPPRLVYRMRKLVRRHRLPLGIAALVVLLLLAGTTTSTYFALQSHDNAQQAQSLLGVANSQRDRADEERDKARRETQAAQAARERAERQDYYTTIRLVTATLDAGQYGGVRETLLECPQNLRGWEWGHLMDRCPKESWKMPAHEGRVNALAVSPDGTSFLSAGNDGRLIMWDVVPSAEASKASDAPRSPQANDASQTNESKSGDWAAVESVTPRWMVTSPLPVRAVAFFPDGIQVAAISAEQFIDGGSIPMPRAGRFFVCDVENGDVRHESVCGGARCFSLSPDGQWLYLGTEGSEDTQPPTVEQYRTSDWKLVRTHELENAPRALAVDRQGEYVAVVDDGHRFNVFETSDWECLWSDTTYNFPSNVWLDYMTGRLVITAWEHLSARDLGQKSELYTYSHDLPITSLDVDRDCGVLVTGGQDGVGRSDSRFYNRSSAWGNRAGCTSPVARRLRIEPLEGRRLLSVDMGQTTVELFGTSPALFVENQGQWADAELRYAFSGAGANVGYTSSGIDFQLFQHEAVDPSAEGEPTDILSDPLDGPEEYITHTAEFSVHFDGANMVEPVGLDRSESVFNYFVGDQANWRAEVPGYETVGYLDLYDGIDLHTRGQRDNLKYEFHVDPGADYSQIQVRYDGITDLQLDARGALHIQTSLGELVDEAPYVYQEIDGQQVTVAGQFSLLDADSYSFLITGSYDPGRPLPIKSCAKRQGCCRLCARNSLSHGAEEGVMEA